MPGLMTKTIYNHQLTSLDQLVKTLTQVQAEVKKTGGQKATAQMFLTETPQAGGVESAIEITWKPESKQ